jgi:hypothetical protein
VALIYHCKLLTTLKIDETSTGSEHRLTETDFTCILGANCAQLTDLTINYCAITDSAIEHILTNCKKITRLDLTNCTLLTDDTIDTICNFSPKLKELYIRRCVLISTECTAELFKHCLNLRVLKRTLLFSEDEVISRRTMSVSSAESN